MRERVCPSVPHGCGERMERPEPKSAMSVMRFVVLGAVGFGIGWAVAGLFNSGFVALYDPALELGRGVDLPRWWVRGLSRFSWFSWFIAGACSGAGLGLALKSWKRVFALAELVRWGSEWAMPCSLRCPCSSSFLSLSPQAWGWVPWGA
jgi:hypothetical protein